MSIENPSLPVSTECINRGDEVKIKIGCVDVSMEGGQRDQRYYGSMSTGTTLVNVTTGTSRGTAVMCFRLPKTIPYGELVDPDTGLPDAGGTNDVCYTRDIVMDAITTFCKDESFTVVSASRGVYVPNLSSLTGWIQSTDSYVEYLVGGAGSALETAFQLDYVGSSYAASLLEDFVRCNEIANVKFHGWYPKEDEPKYLQTTFAF